MDFHDTEWYPMILAGRTGSERPKETVYADSKITKKIEGQSVITTKVTVPSKVIP